MRLLPSLNQPLPDPMPGPRRRELLLAAAGLAPAWATAATATGTAAARPPRVVASFSILADMVQMLAPTGTEVLALVGANADAHAFEPSPTAARQLASADLVVVNGLGFEGWLERLVRASGYRGPVVVATAGLTPRRVGAGPDPHAWHDLANARLYVANLARGLAQRWPAQQAEVQARQADYLKRIDALAVQISQWLAPIPADQRRVITAHGAFGYLGAAHGIEFLSPLGWGSHSAPSAAGVARLIRQVRQQQVRALFLENISDARLLERIAEEGGATLGGTLYSDALSGPDGPAATYLQMVAHNARTLADALLAKRP